jgi:hypothetical protein
MTPGCDPRIKSRSANPSGFRTLGTRHFYKLPKCDAFEFTGLLHVSTSKSVVGYIYICPYLWASGNCGSTLPLGFSPGGPTLQENGSFDACLRQINGSSELRPVGLRISSLHYTDFLPDISSEYTNLRHVSRGSGSHDLLCSFGTSAIPLLVHPLKLRIHSVLKALKAILGATFLDLTIVNSWAISC